MENAISATEPPCGAGQSGLHTGEISVESTATLG